MIARPTTAPRLAATILSTALCGFGCQDLGDRAPDGPRVAVRDSAGVTIVTNDPAAPDSRLPWRFGEQPSLSVGSVDSGEAGELFRVRDAMLLPDGRIAIANAGSYEIKAFAPDGSLVRIVRRDGDPRESTQDELDEYFARQVAGRPAEVRTRMLNMVRDMPLVESYPAFEEIVGDRAGYLWAREYRMFGEGDPVWTVFDPEGRIQGLVETPAGLEVFEIGEDYMLGLAEDELGVEYVQVWALDREGG